MNAAHYVRSPVSHETPVKFQFGSNEITGLVTDVEINYETDSYPTAVFGEGTMSYVPHTTRTFTLRGYVTEDMATLNTNTITYQVGGTFGSSDGRTPEKDPPKSANALKHYRTGGEPTKMGKKLMKKVNWDSERVVLIGLKSGHEVTYAKTLDEKRKLAFDPDFPYLLVSWPGRYSQDIFFITNIDALARELGLKPKSETTFVDEAGEEWSE